MTAPAVVRTRAELSKVLGGRRAGTVALVPTMGALHRGHAALLDDARLRADQLVMSIFVNPLQFGPSEDLDRYPRTFDDDVALCGEHGVDLVFAPEADEVYPEGEPDVTVEPGPLGTVLEGAVRPGHFRGVLTVVAKLFGLVGPDVAVFGQKDYQQLVLIRRMAEDLCMRVEVVGAETVREHDGLALSSRNRYLTASERSSALALSRGLLAGQAMGGVGPNDVLAAAWSVLDAEPGIEPDYLMLTDPSLRSGPESGPARLLVAARVGSTRLIDNVAVDLRH